LASPAALHEHHQKTGDPLRHDFLGPVGDYVTVYGIVWEIDSWHGAED
jgi:hypothetical protein